MNGLKTNGKTRSTTLLPLKAHDFFYYHVIDSPIGVLCLSVNRKGAVCRIDFGSSGHWPAGAQLEANKYACGELALQLSQFFAGERQNFELDLAPEGTDFQRLVWERLMKVPYGSTMNYGELAIKIGRRGASRAVGTAVASNPIPIIIPCHRIILANGKLGNYAMKSLPQEQGVGIKRHLLSLEASGKDLLLRA